MLKVNTVRTCFVGFDLLWCWACDWFLVSYIEYIVSYLFLIHLNSYFFQNKTLHARSATAFQGVLAALGRGDQQDRLKDQEEWELNWAWSSIVSTKTLQFDSSPYAWRSVVNWDRMLMTTSPDHAFTHPLQQVEPYLSHWLPLWLAAVTYLWNLLNNCSIRVMPQMSCKRRNQSAFPGHGRLSENWPHRAKIMETLLVDGLTTMPLCRLCITMQYAQIFLVSSKLERQELRGWCRHSFGLVHHRMLLAGKEQSIGCMRNLQWKATRSINLIETQRKATCNSDYPMFLENMWLWCFNIDGASERHLQNLCKTCQLSLWRLASNCTSNSIGTCFWRLSRSNKSSKDPNG